MGAETFTEAEITECLLAVIAWAGNASAALRQLKAEGKRCPSHAPTLSEWARGKHADRFNELREKYAEQLEAQLAHEYRDVARQAVEVQRAALGKAMERLEKGTDPEPSRTAANAATVADKMTSRMLALQGKPTSIREDRTAYELLRSLVARGILQPPEEPAQIETAK